MRLAPLPCSRWATSCPIPFAPPVISATFPYTESMAATYSTDSGLQLNPKQRVDRRRHSLPGGTVVPPV